MIVSVWAALLLPYLEQDSLRRQIDLQVSVRDPQYDQLRTAILPMFACPSDQRTGVYTILSDLGVPMARAATNSYAASYGSGLHIARESDRGNGLFCGGNEP
jgi:hypothetical protein